MTMTSPKRVAMIVGAALHLSACADQILPSDRIKTKQDALAWANNVCPKEILDAPGSWNVARDQNRWILTKPRGFAQTPYGVSFEKRDGGLINYCGEIDIKALDALQF